KRLPICINQGNWLSSENISNMINPPEIIIIIDHFTINYELKRLDSYELDANVFITNLSSVPGLLQASNVEWPKKTNTNFIQGSGSLQMVLAGNLIKAFAKAWKISYKDLLRKNNFEREVEIKIGTSGKKELRVRALKVSSK